MRKILLFLTIVLLVIITAGCGKESKAKEDHVSKVTIGYFPNLNHAPAIVAKEKQLFEKQLGDDIEVEYITFSGGSDFMTALTAGEIDAGIVGPGPAMNSYTSGVDVKTIASASTGGTVIMSRKDSGILDPEDIEDHTFISPHVGCTHNVQFETYMKNYLDVTSSRTGGTMTHVTGKPAQYSTMFENGDIDVATAPEPWASVLESEGNHVVIDTPDISFGETLPAAIFVTTEAWIDNHPTIVQNIIDAHEEAIDFINENESEAIDLTIEGIHDVTGQELEREIMENAWTRTFFQADVDEEVIQEFGDASFDLKFLKEEPDFSNFVDKQFLN
ncbi:MAG TPA: aliphatic sulfonate ABC transporter substrate-binding protein [Virgibacillus sp.]|nr:aliphatic sulfonate ABC transporter substrate-binding protein [Virgibacillus sp.]HLR67993.1 aliphatic sulfonate ABC transporter substrate-binding protein [Virgibacillus sp.]